MIGNLTFDKASMNMSYFLYSVKIINDNGGIITRSAFVQEMAHFVGVPYMRDTKENRTPYNKSKLPRYFGFIDLATIDGEPCLCITNRGKALAKIIAESTLAQEPSERFYISHENRKIFIDLLMSSVLFDSFGKNNCGAEQSCTDVEPPKIVFKAIQTLQRATAEEICYIIFGLNRKVFHSFQEAIIKIEHNRKMDKYDYSTIMEEWGVTNIVHDCKIINIFTDKNINLIISKKDDDIGKVFYNLSPIVSKKYSKEIENLSPVYEPIQLSVFSKRREQAVDDWLSITVLGRISDASMVVKTDGRNISGINELTGTGRNGSTVGVLSLALLKALDNEKSNVFLVINNIQEIYGALDGSEIKTLFNRVNDYWDDRHGYSASPLNNPELYSYLCKNSRRANQLLNNGNVILPSNLHIIGTVTMKNKEYSVNDFDYSFKTAILVGEETPEEDVQSAAMIDRQPRTHKSHDLNCIIYGAPGTGKTYSTIQYAVDVCNNDPTDFAPISKDARDAYKTKYDELVAQGRVVFTTFHQSYGYEDFIQGLRPDTKSQTIKFSPVDGVFKKIADKAMKDTENDYVIIIDEINRGNISKIFGELITLIEDDKRWGESNQLCVDLPSGQKFAVPNNLYIVGTMNSADKSISLIDAALRRRFQFQEQSPNPSLLSDTVLSTVLEKLNEALEKELDSTDLLIGHSYFIGKDASDLCQIMNRSIIPLLYEYFFDNSKKVRTILKTALEGQNVELVDESCSRIKIKNKV